MRGKGGCEVAEVCEVGGLVCGGAGRGAEGVEVGEWGGWGDGEDG